MVLQKLQQNIPTSKISKTNHVNPISISVKPKITKSGSVSNATPNSNIPKVVANTSAQRQNSPKMVKQVKSKSGQYIPHKQTLTYKSSLPEQQLMFSDKSTPKTVNHNGFSSSTPTLSQAVPVVLVVYLTIEIVIATLSTQESARSIVIGCFLVIILTPLTYLWYLTSKIDPTDSIQISHREHLACPSTSDFVPSKHKYFCNLCKTCIGHKSFHCNKCNRCVEYFDHHCRWLNNCIGSKNYVEFVELISISEIYLLFCIISNTVIAVNIEADDHFSTYFWLIVVTLVIVSIPTVALTMLLSLHVYLIVAKRSTIELIMENRKKAKIHPQNQRQQSSVGFRNELNQFVETPSLMMSPEGQNNDDSLKDSMLLNFRNNLSKTLKFNLKEETKSVTKGFKENKVGFVIDAEPTAKDHNKLLPSAKTQKILKVSVPKTNIRFGDEFETHLSLKESIKQHHLSQSFKNSETKALNNAKVQVRKQGEDLNSSLNQSFCSRLNEQRIIDCKTSRDERHSPQKNQNVNGKKARTEKLIGQQGSAKKTVEPQAQQISYIQDGGKSMNRSFQLTKVEDETDKNISKNYCSFSSQSSSISRHSELQQNEEYSLEDTKSQNLELFRQKQKENLQRSDQEKNHATVEQQIEPNQDPMQMYYKKLLNISNLFKNGITKDS